MAATDVDILAVSHRPIYLLEQMSAMYVHIMSVGAY